MQHNKRLPSCLVACLCTLIIYGPITLQAQVVQKVIMQPHLGVRTASVITVGRSSFQRLKP